jgi:gliding motility-associated-like protein
MNYLSPFSVIAFALSLIAQTLCVAQDCSNPSLLCAQGNSQNANTSQGVPTTLPNDFCFTDAGNAVFFEFQTLDTSQFPDIEYNDSTATLSIQNLSCLSDPDLGFGISLAVFSAADLCDFNSYNTPVFCEDTLLSSGDFTLTGLLPSTAYYVLISGLFGDPPATGPADCEASIDISGPAVTYDLGADWFPEGDENRVPKVIFESETLVLEADPQFPGLSWTGEALNETSGSSVTADPEGVDQAFTYVVDTQINGCTVTDQVTVILRPAIRPFNTFTPNGDGINETWVIDNIRLWPNAQIVVFSRWGQKVFQATNYSNDWDGDDLPAATYYYVIELNPIDFNLDPYTGSVTIIR